MANTRAELHFGFNPSCDGSGLSHISQAIDEESDWPSNRDDALSKGIELLNSLFSQTYRENENYENHVVLLSGGLDSRTILAGLLNHASPDDVETVTFGMPGTYDYEIAPKVANLAGVNHTKFSLEDTDWSVQSLEETARLKGTFSQIFRSNVVRQAVYDRNAKSTVFWDGFMGGALAGENLIHQPPDQWQQACDWFCEWSAGIDQEFWSKEQALSALPSSPFLPKQMLGFDEQLDYGIRQQCFIRPTPSQSQKASPFLRSDWESFMLQLPREWRLNRQFFKELVQQWKPEFFDLPTQSNRGLALSAPKWRLRLRKITEHLNLRVKESVSAEAINPNSMYWDWDAAFRDSDRLKRVGEELMKSLSQRGIDLGLEPVKIFRRHQNGDSLSSTLQVLGSYEIYQRL